MAYAAAPHATPAAAPRGHWLSRLFAALQLHRERVRLAALDDHLLADIGLSRDEAEAAAAQPLWDVPRHWQR
ncbi:DUF1127 domain-containing protein [Tabrizicola sp.]|uniref:DUF1127 domain-containing protein n=1 Tax=Tabrizicola sp. TaxID=2005166 RepID=UPI003F3572EE